MEETESGLGAEEARRLQRRSRQTPKRNYGNSDASILRFHIRPDDHQDGGGGGGEGGAFVVGGGGGRGDRSFADGDFDPPYNETKASILRR